MGFQRPFFKKGGENMIRIIADAAIPFLEGVLEPFADIQYLPANEISAEVVRDVDALLIRTRTRVDGSLLAGSKVQFVATATIGFDHIDTAWCLANGITWVNAPGCNASSVQQYLAAALLAIDERPGFRIEGRTLGIVGVGNVGSKVEKLAKTLGMKVLKSDPPRERREGSDNYVPLDVLMKESDVISLHVPLNREGIDKTFHLINRESVKNLKPGAWLINTSRGEVAETQALKAALDEKRLSGAILDVWENEPNPDRELVLKTFIATPHIAGYSLDGKANGTAMVVWALASHFRLPLLDWFPPQILHAEKTAISARSEKGNPMEIVREAVLQSYDIWKDDARMRLEPGNFEAQRTGYPARREFPAYKVHLPGKDPEAWDILTKLGFTIHH
jgi:erythronate-4-phosphate dehydrogenase